MKTNMIIISDLHIDTWTDAKPFLKFLKEIEPTTKTLYINGDLMDMPPARGEDVCPEGSIAEQVLSALVEFARQPDSRIVYVVGNHDIGLSGLRINYDFQIPWLGGLAITYPRVHIPTEAGGILLEHGHFYDPSLAIFAGDLMLGTYFGEARTAPAVNMTSGLIRRMQRRDPQTSEKVNKAGELKPQPEQPAGCRSIGRNIIKAISGKTRGVVDQITPGIWRDAAFRVLRDYNETVADDEKAGTIIFGHTHIPDTHTWEDDNRYFNIGCWTSGEADYLEVDESGGIKAKKF